MNVLRKFSPQALGLGARSVIISVAGKAFCLTCGKDATLSGQANNFMRKSSLSIKTPEGLSNIIRELKAQGNGLIIANHASGIFPDYLTLFSILGEDILEKCIFYTAEYNLAMNKREFPGYEFRPVPEIGNFSDLKKFYDKLAKDVERINKEGRYLFFMPGGAGKDVGQEFRAMFTRVVKWLNKDIRILSVYSEIPEELQSYAGILQQIWCQTDIMMKIQARLTRAGDWQDKNHRNFYNALHGIKNPS